MTALDLATTSHKDEDDDFEEFDEYVRTDRLCKVARALYLSSQFGEQDKQAIDDCGITHVLQVGAELSESHPGALTYKRVEVEDDTDQDLVVHLPSCIAFIDQGRNAGGVLVHCAAGISRSASVVIAYLMARDGCSLEDARKAVQAVRPFIRPNLGFLLQLQLFRDAGCSAEGWEPWSYSRFLEARKGSTMASRWASEDDFDDQC